MRGILVSIAILVASAAAAQIDNTLSELESMSGLIMESLRAKPQRCRGAPAGVEGAMSSSCGRVHSSYKDRPVEVLNVVDGVLASHGQADEADLIWFREGDAYWRSRPIGSSLFTVEYDTSTRRISMHGRPLPADCVGIESVPMSRTPAFTHPEIIPESHVGPEYPKGTAAARRKATVILWAVIRKDGSVGPLCVRGVNPAGLGFEQAATEAVRQWRYVPAMKDGEPVDVRIRVYVEFSKY